MDKVATLSDIQRGELFKETGLQRGLQAAIIEKDFWVCWTLGHIFNIEQTRDVLQFKGGTALAKVFHLIERFSEDIDLVIDYEPLGFVGPRDPMSNMSRNKRERLLSEMMTACHTYIAEKFMTILRRRFQETLGDTGKWALSVDSNDPNTVRFRYPSASVGNIDYIRPDILLELGTHAELIPSGQYSVTPFAAEQFPNVFKHASCMVKAIKAHRTFWEKATILHVEHHRPMNKPMPTRHARHYYDMVMLSRSAVCENALNDFDLLRRVVEHKTKFYYADWAKYDLAVPATLSLLPTHERVRELERDYAAMSTMIFGEPPPLSEILGDLAVLERRINET